MSAPPVPRQCIWCCKRPPDVEFDTSHVVPECFGNSEEIGPILPPGIVCKGCNRKFGRKIETALIRDVILRPILVNLGPIDPGDLHAFRDRFFDPVEYREDGPVMRHLRMSLDVPASGDTIAVNLACEIRGRHTRTYQPKDLAFLSRAFHKLAFEFLAWRLYVKGCDDPVDLFSPEFDAVRAWARRGQPIRGPRAFLVRPPTDEITRRWCFQLLRFDRQIVLELNLFGVWYAMQLTAENWIAEKGLCFWFQELQSQHAEPVLCVSDKIRVLRRKPAGSEGADS